jgi:hypothetical protein
MLHACHTGNSVDFLYCMLQSTVKFMKNKYMFCRARIPNESFEIANKVTHNIKRDT